MRLSTITLLCTSLVFGLNLQYCRSESFKTQKVRIPIQRRMETPLLNKRDTSCAGPCGGIQNQGHAWPFPFTELILSQQTLVVQGKWDVALEGIVAMWVSPAVEIVAQAPTINVAF